MGAADIAIGRAMSTCFRATCAVLAQLHLTEEDTGRGLLPDFRLDQLPGPGAGLGPLGNVLSTLAELKVIGAVETFKK